MTRFPDSLDARFRPLLLTLLLVACFGATQPAGAIPVPAQASPSPPAPDGATPEAPVEPSASVAAAQASARYEAALSFEFRAFDNFFQAPDGAPSTNIYGLRMIGRLGYQVSPDLPLMVFGELGRTLYDDIDDSTIVAGGIEYDDDLQAVTLSVGLETDRPALDVGDGFETADVITIDAEYGYHLTRDWEVIGNLVLQDQSFAVTTANDNYILGVGPAVRYRGFGSEFSPEVGVLFGGRNAADDNENHSQTDLYVQVRSVPTPPVYLSFRFRHRTRGYDTTVPTASNFQREDTRRQFVALGVIELTENVDLNVYYTFQDAESTLPSRTFNTQLLFAGASYAWGRR